MMNFLKNKLTQFFASLVFLAVMASPVQANVLTGDVRLSCEALLCLSSAVQPGACAPSLSRYFSITGKKWSDVFNARWAFLMLCPATASDNNMKELSHAIINGAGRCDANSLNYSLIVFGDESSPDVISNMMPWYCSAYINSPYTDLSSVTPVYVGIPSRGGYWVEPVNYAAALAAYQRRIEEEDRAREEENY